MASEAQREFTRRMNALLQEGLPLFGMEADAQLGDWICIISAPSINGDGELVSGYSITFSGSCLDHSAKGLLTKGRELMETGEVHEDG